MKKNILVGQSGGPTAVINASLYGIIKEAAAHSEQIGSVYGMIRDFSPDILWIFLRAFR